jgi:hypothetical protein
MTCEKYLFYYLLSFTKIRTLKEPTKKREKREEKGSKRSCVGKESTQDWAEAVPKLSW